MGGFQTLAVFIGRKKEHGIEFREIIRRVASFSFITLGPMYKCHTGCTSQMDP